MKRVSWVVLALATVACSESSPDTEPVASSEPAASAASPASAASAAPSASAAPEVVSGCTMGPREVIATGVNPRTGLTPQRFSDGSVSVGIAIGNQPRRLRIDPEGKKSLEKVAVPTGHPLRSGIPRDEGVRHVQRVTPTQGATVYVDYRDKHEDGRRRISCGPLGGKTFLYHFGDPLLDVDTSGRKKEPAAAPSASASASASAAASASVVPVPDPAPAPRKGPLLEIRDCRTLVDPLGNDAFAIGSELAGNEKDGKTTWEMRFFVTKKEGDGPRTRLHTIPLGEAPEKLYTLEAPVAYHLPGGAWAVAGRYRGQMYGWVLDADKRLQGKTRRYSGGYPSLPRYASPPDGPVLLVSQAVAKDTWKLRGNKLPDMSATMFDPVVKAESAAEPTLAMVGDQRWLAYHAGDRRHGRVSVVPVDPQLRQTGDAFDITEEDADAYESILLGFGDDLELLSILRKKGAPTTQLVSHRFTCHP